MLKSMFFAIAIMACSALTLPQTVQATPILTQELLDLNGNSLGMLSVDLGTIDDDGFIFEWLEFELFGFSELVSERFIASVDPENLAAGLNFFFFDVSDIDFTLALQGNFEFGAGTLEMRNFPEGTIISVDDIVLGNARLVSAPATLFLMLAAAGGLLLRRRD